MVGPSDADCSKTPRLPATPAHQLSPRSRRARRGPTRSRQGRPQSQSRLPRWAGPRNPAAAPLPRSPAGQRPPTRAAAAAAAAAAAGGMPAAASDAAKHACREGRGGGVVGKSACSFGLRWPAAQAAAAAAGACGIVHVCRRSRAPPAAGHATALARAASAQGARGRPRGHGHGPPARQAANRVHGCRTECCAGCAGCGEAGPECRAEVPQVFAWRWLHVVWALAQ